jgi:hypothetical protein
MIIEAIEAGPALKISRIRNVCFAFAVLVIVFYPGFLYPQEVLYPAGYEIISTYQLSETNISLLDTLIIQRTIVNNEAFPLDGLYFSDNLPPAFCLISYFGTVNGDSVSIQFSGGLEGFVMADCIFYEWVLDKPDSTGGINNKINPGDTAVLEVRLISDSIGSFVFPLHAAPFYGNGIAFFSTSEPITVNVDSSIFPQAPSDFILQPGHEKCKLSWSNPSGITGVEIRRNPWVVGAYPEYDDDYPTPLGYPADESEGELVYQGLGESYVDSANTNDMPRNIYYYTIFSYDEAGNYSTATTAQQGRATNYWLGDVSRDGSVYYEDLTVFSVCYWTLDGNANYNAEFDIGPTIDGSARGIPATDNAINFEDLMVFVMNYGNLGPNQKVVPILPEEQHSGQLGLSLEREPGILNEGDECVVRILLHNNPGTLKGLHIQVPYDRSVLRLLEVRESPDLSEASDLLFFDGRELEGRVDLSLGLLGRGSTIGGSGHLATMSFRLLRPGELSLCFAEVDLRDLDNQKLNPDFVNLASAYVASMPMEYGLWQNRPNPFNLETVITYHLPIPGEVSLKVYNIQGQVVRTLVSEYNKAGVHTITWDGKNDQGQEIASGVYLYRLEAGSYSNTKKMSLLK